MTSMLEKIARAIGEVPATSTDDVRHVLSEGAIERVARAALLAMREPDRDMIWAGNDEDGYYADGTQFNAECAIHWRAMIDAILKEGGE